MVRARGSGGGANEMKGREVSELTPGEALSNPFFYPALKGLSGRDGHS